MTNPTWSVTPPEEAGERWFRGPTEPERIAYCGPKGVQIGDQWRIQDDYEYGPRVESPAVLAALGEVEAALRAWQEWWETEDAGPDYPDGMTRDSEGGEAIWREWYYGKVLPLCERANLFAPAALAALDAAREKEE